MDILAKLGLSIDSNGSLRIIDEETLSRTMETRTVLSELQPKISKLLSDLGNFLENMDKLVRISDNIKLAAMSNRLVNGVTQLNDDIQDQDQHEVMERQLLLDLIAQKQQELENLEIEAIVLKTLQQQQSERNI